MRERIEARVALCKCNESKKIYGVRFQECDSKWEYTWAFSIKEENAKREGYDATQIVGEIEPTEDYPGCPFCGAKYFVICSCGKLNCNNGIMPFICGWCGVQSTLTENYDGSGFCSGDDI